MDNKKNNKYVKFSIFIFNLFAEQLLRPTNWKN